MTDYPDDQIRQELVDFFGWRPRDVLKLSRSELVAWKRHWLQLKERGWR